jgi:hypothetical protein
MGDEFHIDGRLAVNWARHNAQPQQNQSERNEARISEIHKFPEVYRQLREEPFCWLANARI